MIRERLLAALWAMDPDSFFLACAHAGVLHAAAGPSMEVDDQGLVRLATQLPPHCAARSDLLLVLRRSGVLLLSGTGPEPGAAFDLAGPMGGAAATSPLGQAVAQDGGGYAWPDADCAAQSAARGKIVALVDAAALDAAELTRLVASFDRNLPEGGAVPTAQRAPEIAPNITLGVRLEKSPLKSPLT